MTVEYVSLKSDMNIGQALNYIKKVGIKMKPLISVMLLIIKENL